VSDEEEPVSVVDAAYKIIVDSDKDWTKDELIAGLAQAGFRLDDDAELEAILDAVRERIESENILNDAIQMFLGESGFRDLRHAAEELDCTVAEAVEMIVANTNLFGKPH